MRANLVNYLENFVTAVLFVVKLSCKILSTEFQILRSKERRSFD